VKNLCYTSRLISQAGTHSIYFSDNPQRGWNVTSLGISGKGPPPRLYVRCEPGQSGGPPCVSHEHVFQLEDMKSRSRIFCNPDCGVWLRYYAKGLAFHSVPIVPLRCRG